MPPKFSVVVPTFNRELYVGRTLASLAAQTLTDYELIVVDDGSTDRTLDAVRRAAPHAKILEQSHAGCAAARNLGVREANGEYIAFLDSDDFWFPWSLETYNAAVDKAGSPTFVGGRLHTFKSEPEVDGVERAPLDLIVGKDFFSTALQADWGYGVTHGVVRRSEYLAVGGCVEKDINGTDTDILFRLGVSPGCVIINRPLTVAYRLHEGSVSFDMERMLAGLRMFSESEKKGLYPGGRSRRRDRRNNISARMRGASRVAVSYGQPGIGWELYRKSFLDSVVAGRMLYLTAMPPIVAWHAARSAVGLGATQKLRMDA